MRAEEFEEKSQRLDSALESFSEQIDNALGDERIHSMGWLLAALKRKTGMPEEAEWYAFVVGPAGSAHYFAVDLDEDGWTRYA